ncbi:MAG TPA: tetratricopeptide repeat protein [Pyrinomonadaceae bacterium]|jgi:tetratricopeptide (TPR) repeat protein
MRKGRIASFLVAVVLAVGLVAPWTAQGSTLSDAVIEIIFAVDTTDDAEQQASNDQSSTATTKAARKNRNSLGRALSASFRALGKLFGSGKKKQTPDEIAHRKELEKQREDARKAAAQAAQIARQTAEDNRRKEKEERLRADKNNIEAARRQREERAKAARRDDESKLRGEVLQSGRSAVAPPPPAVWKPVIEGVPRDNLSQGRALLRHGYVNEAIAELSIAATVGPELIEANTLLGVAHDHIGQHRQAQEYYERALSVAPYNAELLYNFGHSLYLVGDFNGAMKRLKVAARVSPNDPRIPYSTGLVQVRLGRYDDAFKSLARVGGDFAARIKMASMLEDANRAKDAIKQYEAALRLEPTAPIALERLAALYQRTGRRNEAEAVRRNTVKPPAKPVTGG